MVGHIKIDRKILSWQWYKDINTFKLFTHLLIIANHKEKNWRGTNVLRGQLITGRLELSKDTGLSEMQIRTSLNKLKSTGEITTKSSNKNTIITICNYDTYQSVKTEYNQQSNQQTIQQVTNKYPTNNQQVTTNNNDKNNKNIEEKEINISFDDFWDLYDKKVGDKGKLKKKWFSLTKHERELAMQHIPKYKISQPDKKFRKDPSTYLNNKAFNDEIIGLDDQVVGEHGLSGLNVPQNANKREYWEVRYGHLAKSREEFMKLVDDGVINDF